jgi:signal transduction histidine kinase
MWQKLFDAPWPDTSNLLPLPVQEQAAEKIRGYWRARGWQLVLGEVVIWIAATYQNVPLAKGYGVLALLVGIAYALGFLHAPFTWLMGSSTLFLIQAIVVESIGPVTALTFIMPYTFAGMLLSGRWRVIVQSWCMVGFWVSLIYGVLPGAPQLAPPNHLIISYDILLAVFTFQTMRFLNHLTVAINSAYVTEEIRGQSQHFLARVSHELRTPLNSVLGFAKLLRHRELAEREQHYVDQIIEEGEQLNRLVSDLLDSSHLSTGKMTLRFEPCDINALCQAVAEEHSPALAEVQMNTELAPGLPMVKADSVRLRQAVGNLVSNAVKYTTQGEITVRTYQRGATILIDVCDTGIGIAVAQQSLVFLPFVQLDERRTGVGLGLDIALRIVRLHGGDILLYSVPNEGSTFTIELPI